MIQVEFYSGASEALRPHVDPVDTWVLLEMPASGYDHKHLMFDVGIVLAGGGGVRRPFADRRRPAAALLQ